MAESIYVSPVPLVESPKSWDGWQPRNGQWVLFKPADGKQIPFAHVTAGGLHVGIWQRAARKTSAVVARAAEQSGQAPPKEIVEMMAAHIVVVNVSGDNCPHIDDRGNFVSHTLRLAPHGVTDLQPLLDKADMPADRRDGLHPDGSPKTHPYWTPRA